jgi:hypothetical protein
VSEDLEPLSYLNPVERRLIGLLVRHLCSTANPRFSRAVERTGPEATVRMACVNALRIYAIGLFVAGTLARFAGVWPLGYALLVLAAAAMVWSFWCLYTVARPEREFKRAQAARSHPGGRSRLGIVDAIGSRRHGGSREPAGAPGSGRD